MTSSELWIIEAPGKAQTLEAILAKLGRKNARVQATKGHLLSMPNTLTPLGIDKSLYEYMREPKDLSILKYIRDFTQETKIVYIATDADQEGDVIAYDVFDMIQDIVQEKNLLVLRVKLKGMDDESIKEAIEVASPISKEEAIPGRTRALVDRLIGATFSNNGTAVGRVGTALLGLIDREKPTTLRLTLSAPARDGGRPWLAETDIKAPLTRKIAESLVELTFPALDMAGETIKKTLPNHMGDVMISASAKLDISPLEASKAMQRGYEEGRLSYPRAGARAMNRIMARKLKKMIAASGYKFDENNIAEKNEKDVHDAPYVIGKVDVTQDPCKMGIDDGVRTLIARDLVKAGQDHQEQVPFREKIKDFLLKKGYSQDIAFLISELHWRRENGPRYPGQENWQDSEIVERRPDTVVLELMVKADLGKPSTWANHVEGFISRGLVDNELNITAKGREWIANSPPALLDPRISIAIEKACEKIHSAPIVAGREPWETLAERIIKALPVEIRSKIEEKITEEPHLRQNFRELVKEGLDFNTLKESSPSLQMAYRPEEV